MSLKNRLSTLKTASMGGLGTDDQANLDSTSRHEPIMIREILESDYTMTDQEYQSHVEKLRKNIIGQVFSVGDERLLKNAFDFIASTKRGRRIIEEVPENMQIRSTDIPGDFAAAGLYWRDKIDIDKKYVRERHADSDGKKMTLFGQEIRIHPSEARVLDILIDSPMNFKTVKKAMQEMMNAKQVDFQAVETLWHELRHAMQDQKGLMLKDENVNVDQKLTVGKLYEADAKAWDIVNTITYEFIDGGFLVPDTGPRVNKDLVVHLPEGDSYTIAGTTQKERLDSFKKYNLDNLPGRSKNKKDSKLDNGISFTVESEGHINPVVKYASVLQDNLKKYNDLDLAQRATVGEIIADYMKPKESHPDLYWLQYYDQVSVRNTVWAVEKGYLTPKGNEAAFDRVLGYYEQEYGVPKEKIKNHHVDPYYQRAIEALNRVVIEKSDALKEGDVFNNQQTNQSTSTFDKHSVTQKKPHRPNGLLSLIEAARSGQTMEQHASEIVQKTSNLGNIETKVKTPTR